MNKSSIKILNLIDRLGSLHEGEHAVDLLIASGEEAIPPLRKYLMEGKPSHIYQPRQRAVNALAQLGAKEVLIEYLCTPKEIPDPAFEFGEEAVENTAARALATWQTEDVFEVLLRIAYTRTLPGVIETLSSFQRPETVPLFIAALMDDVSRTAAENALKSMGEIAKPALMEAAATFSSSENDENPSNLLLRRSSVHLLVDMTMTAEEWSKIKYLLYDNDPEISVSAARIALKIGDFEDKRTAIGILVEKIPHTSWYVQMEIENTLVKHYAVAGRNIKDWIEQRRMQPERAQTFDPVLQMLLRVQKRVDGCSVNLD